MSLAAYQNSQDLDVLSATPIQLVRLLYVGAIGAVQAACGHLEAGDIRSRSKQITKACSIIEELMMSLDKERGGKVADDLNELYAYVHQRLIVANIEQQMEPLVESKRILETLLEAWNQLPDGQADSSRASGSVSGLRMGGYDDFPEDRPSLQLTA